MKTLNIQQGSAAWLEVRANHYTASEAPAMMGVSKHQTRNALIEQKATGITPEVTPAQQRIFDKGHAAEASARPIAEEIIEDELFPVTAISDEHQQLLASYDGITVMDDVIWEHKLINQELRSATAETLAEHYKVQMDQQLLVSGAEKCLFMASDGTKQDCNWFWYTADQSRFDALLAGWKQFDADLKDYSPTEAKPAPVAKAQADLPALVVELVGEVRSSNLSSYSSVILERIRSVKTDLQTDQDFADADGLVKFFNGAEKELDTVKKQALGQTASIDELFKTIDQMKSEMRSKRLELDKLVKARKQQIRAEIIEAGNLALAQHIEDLDAQLGEFCLPVITCDFAGAIKGKRTVETLKSSASDELARSKIAATQAFERIKANIATFEELAGEYRHIFQDSRQLVQLEPGHMAAEVKSRIADHREAEAKRLEAERERIRQEEAAKLQQQTAAAAQQPAESEPAVATRSEPAAPATEQRPTQLHPHELIDVAADDTITITQAEYDQLQRDSRFLAALRAQGVDNWVGYDAAIDALSDAA